jgi:hypothetical protein
MTATAATVAEPSASANYTLFFLLIPALILYFVYWKLQRRRFVELADKLPGPKGLPIVGHGFSFLGSSLRKFHSEGFRKKMWRLWLMFLIRRVIFCPVLGVRFCRELCHY